MLYGKFYAQRSDDNPSTFNHAAHEIETFQEAIQKRLCGGFEPEALPGYPTLPQPVIEGQVLAFPVYNNISLARIGTLVYVARLTEKGLKFVRDRA